MTEIKDLIEISILCCVSCCMNSFEESILIVIWASNKIGVIFVLTETKLQLKFARLWIRNFMKLPLHSVL